ncbi:hypothetical protein CUN91_00160 [Candidatus Carsonella ruddii]|uniref:homoserine dehydrogenase n=1 Tax=Carsonella ruddii TaxID=114186 RepID=A0A2K8K438_CARRU|nr:hypothetical protein [Candidatus Carsonella ruddii]ATX33370.1 hypothetical protein CUN91_00160 [Candidatus Carsonella ruddii]
MDFSIFGLGNVGNNVFNILNKKNKILTFSKNNRFNCLNKFNKNKYEKLFKNKNLFIELIGNIHVVIEIILNCLKKKNNYISANKDLISKYLFFINYLFKINNKKIYYEASVCGSLPIINLLDKFYSKENINYFFGILNGTCNYILTNIEKMSFLKLIKISIKKGISEKNYEKDIFGFDTLFKFSILLSKIKNFYICCNIFYLESIFNLSNYIRKIFFKKKFLSFYLNINNYLFINVSLFLTKNIFFIKSKNSLNTIILNCKNSKKTVLTSLGAGGLSTAASVVSNFYQFFEKKIFFKYNCFKKVKIINKNFLCLNYLIKFKFDYNIFYFLNILKINFLKFYFNKYILIKTKKIYYKKILFFLYFFKKKKFFIYKLL